MTRLRVAVVGAGIGLQHLAAYAKLADQFEIVALADPDESRQKLAAEHFEIPRALPDLDAVFDLGDAVDVVDVCTPPDLHAEMIRRGLEAGKHVVCEKPLVGTLAACDAVAEQERASGRRVMPIFQYRFGRGLQKLLHLIGQGLAGRCYLSTSETSWKRGADYYSVPWRGKWKTERGGALLSHAIHNHDIVCCVAGDVRRVAAHATTRVNPIETEDCAAASLELVDGSLATLAVTLGSAVEISRLRFCFEHFTAESGHPDPYRPGAEPWTFTATRPEEQQKLDAALADFVPEPQGYAGQFARFQRAIVEGGELPVRLADARRSIELVTALYRSASTGEAVGLPIAPDDAWYQSWLPPEHREA